MRASQRHTDGVAAVREATPVEVGQVVPRRFESADRRRLRHGPSSAQEFVLEEAEVEGGVMGGERCPGEVPTEVGCDVRELRSVGYVRVSDAMDVGGAYGPVRVDAG